MYRNFIFSIVFGAFGITLLCCLGVWQLQRLEWKTQLLRNLEQRIVESPIELGEDLDEERDQYRSVVVSGILQDKEIHVLTSRKNVGPGFLVISPFRLLNGKVILVDRGFIEESKKNTIRTGGTITITGNLLWPEELDRFTPDPNIKKNIWFARDLNRMAEYLGASEILVVARKEDPPGTTLPQRVGINIANNHLNYAITWFSLACIWFGMTSLFIYRIKKNSV